MKSNFEYVDSLPKVPEDLVNEVLKAEQNPNIFVHPEYQNYRLHQCTRPINVWAHPLFGWKHIVGVQYMKNNVKIHTDFNRTVAYNYILDQGGNDVATCFYDSDNNLIERHVIEPFRWHRLNVSTPHSVEGITGTRISITVWPAPKDL